MLNSDTLVIRQVSIFLRGTKTHVVHEYLQVPEHVIICLLCTWSFQVGAANPMVTGQVTGSVPCLSVATEILKSSEWWVCNKKNKNNVLIIIVVRSSVLVTKFNTFNF